MRVGTSSPVTSPGTRHGSGWMTALSWLLRLSAVPLLLTAIALTLGPNGLGLLSTDQTHWWAGTRDAIFIMSEQAQVAPRLGEPVMDQLGNRVGSVESRSDEMVRAYEASPTGMSSVLAEFNGYPQIEVSFWGPSLGQRWAWVTVRALPALAGALGLWILAALVRSAGAGDPFTRRNVRRLTQLTALVLVAGIVGDWGREAVRLWLLETSDLAGDLVADARFSWWWLGVAAVLGVITAVWRRGVAMRADLEGLV